MKIEVVKKDGDLEEYNEQKISRVVKAAGLSQEEAEALAGAVTAWIRLNNFVKVTHLQIRNRVIEELEKVNKYSAGLFAWYEKTKDGKK